MNVDQIEAEISRRIRERHDMADGASNMSKAKHRAAASALSELLGWIRKPQIEDNLDKEAEGWMTT